MKLVKNEEKYWDFIRILRNHPVVKLGFVRREEITKEQHKKFMSTHGDNYYICLIENTPAGFVGQINDDIRVATHPDFQGKSVGKFMINQLIKRHPAAFAKVKVDNEASFRLFEACGFKKKYYILENNAS